MDWRFLFEKYVLGQHREFPEPEVLRFLKKIRGNLFVDIGANVGIYGRSLSRNFKRIIAFEPNPEVVNVLMKNLEALRHTDWQIWPIALGDTKGRTMFYRDPHDGFSGSADTILPIFNYRPNIRPNKAPDHIYQGKIGFEVDMDTYDALMGDSKADLVKMDIEGAEFLALKGMERSFVRRGIKRIVIELHDRERKSELEVILSKRGFQTLWLDPDRVFGELEGIDDQTFPYREV